MNINTLLKTYMNGRNYVRIIENCEENRTVSIPYFP